MQPSRPRFSDGEISLWYTGTHMLRKPTPNPLVMRPNTIMRYPFVKAWNRPPIEKMHAPTKMVARRPKMSPTRPAMRDVTARSEQEDERGGEERARGRDDRQRLRLSPGEGGWISAGRDSLRAPISRMATLQRRAGELVSANEQGGAKRERSCRGGVRERRDAHGGELSSGWLVEEGLEVRLRDDAPDDAREGEGRRWTRG